MSYDSFTAEMAHAMSTKLDYEYFFETAHLIEVHKTGTTLKKKYFSREQISQNTQKLQVNICQHLDITNLLCQGEWSGPVTEHRGTSQWRTVRERLDSWPPAVVIWLVMHQITCRWQASPLKDCLAGWGQECDWSNSVSRWEFFLGIVCCNLFERLAAQVTAFRKLLVTRSRGQKRGWLDATWD